MVNPTNGKEIILSLSDGGEAQLWERKVWDRYLKFVNENPVVKQNAQGLYPWTYVEDLTPPNDINNIVLLPEKTGGKEFQSNINAKN